ncbi:unnamed protein product [Gordionus sp. m RMFG-2023]|uniref:sorbitol dehydrogenase-like isoform X2 n=1 Tax=Gordionus sp. m RMFG-2023 TaxID=3053472 RepID=UPI0030E58B57
MQALVLKKVHDLIIEERDIPEPGENEVLIETAYVGICGSDVHYWQEGRIGDFVLNKPMIMGHETSGVVCKLGSQLVNPLQIGDRVCIEPGVPCRHCSLCKAGTYNLCPLVKFHATPPYDGTLRRYFAHPSDFCHKIPAEMNMQMAALVEPMAVGYFALLRSRMPFGGTVLISGAGPIGLCCLICAINMGASKVYITDMLENRLKAAKLLGADHTLQIIPSSPDTFNLTFADKDANDPNKNRFETFFEKHDRPDVTFEATGSESGIELALKVTKPGGKLICIGFSFHPTKIKVANIIVKQIDILGIFRYANCFPQTISLLHNCRNKEEIRKIMITHMFNFSESLEAYTVAKENSRNNAVKVMIKVSDHDK